VFRLPPTVASDVLDQRIGWDRLPGLSILTDAILAPGEREPSIPSISDRSCSAPNLSKNRYAIGHKSDGASNTCDEHGKLCIIFVVGAAGGCGGIFIVRHFGAK
jgi:hypothetical protein